MEWDKYEEVKAGQKEETEILEVKEGKQADFRTEAYWLKVDATAEEIEEMKGKPAIQIMTKNGARMIINMPDGKLIYPNSNLGLFKKTYGQYPSENVEVMTKVDENGFKKIILEK